jgi:hypothetical protein
VSRIQLGQAVVLKLATILSFRVHKKGSLLQF